MCVFMRVFMSLYECKKKKRKSKGLSSQRQINSAVVDKKKTLFQVSFSAHRHVLMRHISHYGPLSYPALPQSYQNVSASVSCPPSDFRLSS